MKERKEILQQLWLSYLLLAMLVGEPRSNDWFQIYVYILLLPFFVVGNKKAMKLWKVSSVSLSLVAQT